MKQHPRARAASAHGSSHRLELHPLSPHFLAERSAAEVQVTADALRGHASRGALALLVAVATLAAYQLVPEPEFDGPMWARSLADETTEAS